MTLTDRINARLAGTGVKVSSADSRRDGGTCLRVTFRIDGRLRLEFLELSGELLGSPDASRIVADVVRGMTEESYA